MNRNGRIGGGSFAWLFVAAAAGMGAACGNPYGGSSTSSDSLHATIGPQGGQLVGAKGSALDGVTVVIPAGALASDTDIEIKPASDTSPLPSSAVRCGPQIEIGPMGTALAIPAQVTLPFDPELVAENNRFDDEVKVWVHEGDQWGQQTQVDSSPGHVTVELSKLDLVGAGVNRPSEADEVHFDLHANPKFLNCLAQFPGDPKRAPSVDVTVVRGSLNDGLFLSGRNIKQGLKFDLFTLQNSTLNASGAVDPSITSVGLAWYQSDLEANNGGRMRATIRTVLLDEIFGFDPLVGLTPTNTFHVGFWFDDPNDAAACGFNVAAPTPFNGDHKAGPLAMISLPDATTGLGPLCTKPDTSTTPAHCAP